MSSNGLLRAAVFENAMYCTSGGDDDRVLVDAAGAHILELFAADAASGGDSVGGHERKSLPTHGMSPRTGTLSLTLRTSSRVKPPRTTVAPSNTVT